MRFMDLILSCTITIFYNHIRTIFHASSYLLRSVVRWQSLHWSMHKRENARQRWSFCNGECFNGNETNGGNDGSVASW